MAYNFGLRQALRALLYSRTATHTYARTNARTHPRTVTRSYPACILCFYLNVLTFNLSTKLATIDFRSQLQQFKLIILETEGVDRVN